MWEGQNDANVRRVHLSIKIFFFWGGEIFRIGSNLYRDGLWYPTAGSLGRSEITILVENDVKNGLPDESSAGI